MGSVSVEKSDYRKISYLSLKDYIYQSLKLEVIGLFFLSYWVGREREIERARWRD